MRNVLYKLSIAFIVLSLTACFEEELLIDQVSEAPNVIISGSTSYLNGETNSVNLNFDFQESDNSKVGEVLLTKQLITSEGTSEVVNLSPLQATTELSFTSAELFADVPVNGQVLTEKDLAPGDKWVFSMTIISADGRELTSLANKEWEINFSCPSDIAATYSATSSGTFGDGAGGAASSYAGLTAVITLTASATDGVYEIDDMSFGLYPQGYGDTAPSGSIRDICNGLSDLGDTDQYNDPFTMTGTVNADGSIDLSWSNTYGDSGQVVLVPNE